jgi:cytochrome d ubiquinol oxidase subunit I
VSPSVGFSSIVISLVIFVLLYVALALVDLFLMLRYSRRDLEPLPGPADGADAADVAVPAVRY